MSELTMPKLSDSMEQGTILSWLRRDGERIEAGEDLVEIETDKATLTYQAQTSGVLRIVAPEGTSLPVGAIIADVQTDDAQMPEHAPAVDQAEARESIPAAAVPALPSLTASDAPSPPAVSPIGANGDGVDVRVTPVARRVAARHGVVLDAIQGSGPLGRITRSDVLRQAGLPEELPSPIPGPTPTPAPNPPPQSADSRRLPTGPEPPNSAKGDVELLEPTRLQEIVARRMAEAKATIPHFQVQTDVGMGPAIALRQQLKETGTDAIPSFNDMIVKAAGLALRAHPLVNGSYRDGHFEFYGRANIGIAVAGDGVLVVPTIFDADAKSLGAIAADTLRLASRVRDGSVTPAELAGATFTVSNLGMYGMTSITPVINAPQAAILGVGAVRETLARVDDEIVDRPMMTLTLSCDHRILYGAYAAQFLSSIRAVLEAPLRLAL